METPNLLRLERDSWFGTLPAARRAAILGRLRTRAVAEGTRLYRLGDPPNGLHVVIEGQVRLVSYPAAGTEMVAMIVRPGRWFGELSVIDGRPRPHDAIAAGAVRAGHLGMADLTALAEEDPLWWRDLALLTCAHQRLAIRETGRTRSQPAVIRLAILLAGLAGRGDPIVRITQEELASAIGISRQRANRLLADLDAAMLIRRAYGGIEVRDPARLRALIDDRIMP